MTGTGDGVNPNDTWHTEWTLSTLAPQVMARFRAAAQQHDQLGFIAINWIQVPTALLATAVLPIAIIALRRRRPPIAALAFTALLALLANAAICGIFSGPHDRYQSRLVPIAALVAMLTLLDRRYGAGHHDGPHAPCDVGPFFRNRRSDARAGPDGWVPATILQPQSAGPRSPDT